MSILRVITHQTKSFSFQVHISNIQLHRCPWPRILNVLESMVFDATSDVSVSPKLEFKNLSTTQQTFRVVRNSGPTVFAYLGNWRLRVREDDCPVCLEPIGVEESGDRGHVELPECQASFVVSFCKLTLLYF